MNSSNVSYSPRGHKSVFAELRPAADPNVIRQIEAEKEAAQRAQAAEAERLAKLQQQQNNANNPNQRDLPDVNTSPIAGGFQSANSSAAQAAAAMEAQINAAASTNQSWAVPSAPPPPPQAASYGINYQNPSPGFVPPPPAVSLSTSAVPMGYGTPPPDYANPYGSPYGYAPPQQPAAPSRAPGSMFGSATSGASKASSSDDDDAPKKKKTAPIQIITPTGMEPRSPYKQRDELRLLWKGAIATSLAGANADPKIAETLAKVDVGLPPEASKGSLSIAQRQVDALFKNAALDKRVIAQAKKVELDLVQAYYRYLYAYNKFFLTQQQVAARKQQLDCADNDNEKQRATVDLANSQQEADASKDDMRSAQGDLAAIVGAASARTVIKSVSGVSPSLDAIAQADPQPQAQGKGGEGGIGGILNVFGFGKSNKSKDNADTESAPVVADSKGKEKKEKEKDKDKDKDKKKGKGDKQVIAAKPQESTPSPKADAAEQAAPPPAAPQGAVSFELKNVKTTPRKSILSVVVRNGGGDNFSFNADSITVAEGSSKLAEAAVAAEFDSTVVQPSQEVTGTITIFGRPWNDKLTVSLSDGSKPILLRR